MTRRPGIDALRGVAVGLVMMRHAFPAVFPGAGVVGVVMFFALSGHLITGVLLDELRRTGRVDLRAFYVRRARRLVPALLAFVSVFTLVTVILDPLHDRAELVRTVAVALTWTADLPFHHGSAATFHLWTLAMEEQFYLLWPAALMVAFRWRRLPVLLGSAAALCLAGTVGTVLWLHAQPDLAYTLPTSWSLCFVIGAASAVWKPSIPDVTGCLLVLLGLCLIPLRGHAATYLLAAPAIAALTVVVLSSWREQAKAQTGLVALGTVSYAAYLWNYPLSLWLPPLVALPATVAAAALSWRYVEEPVRARGLPRVSVPA
jgi:peptidoglycan/LPS O-acetylase OafA/YrhL